MISTVDLIGPLSTVTVSMLGARGPAGPAGSGGGGGGSDATTSSKGIVQLAGDWGGTAASPINLKVNGVSFSSVASTIGLLAIVTAAGIVGYAALDLAVAASVTGLLPAANQAAQALTGDVAGTTAANTVTLAGDVTGRAGVTVVGKVQGVTYPSPGAFVAGTILRATGVSTLALGALDLANVSAVTGLLPIANQVAQAMGGDVAGTTAASTVTLAGDATGRVGTVVVAKVNGVTYGAGGSLTVGTVPRVTGSGATSYGALDLANTSAVTGSLPSANQVAQTLLGDVTGNTGASVVAKANGATIPAAGSLTTNHLIMVSGSSALTYALLANANVSASAAIAGTKIAPDFGSQNVVSTGSGTFNSLRVASLTAGIGHYDSSGNLTSSAIVDADVSASAAVAGTKISPNFGSQAVVTTGSYSASAIPASAGDIRLGDTSSIRMRNHANGADVYFLLKLASDSIVLGGDGSLGSRVSQILYVSSSTQSFYAGNLNSAVMNLTSGGMTIDAGAPAAWTYSAQSSNVATKDWTLTSNGPFASATGSNRNPGNFVWKVPAAASGGTEGMHQFQVAATAHAQIDGTIADGETSLWLRRNVGAVFTLQRVTMGVADSGGAGFKLLRVAN